MCRNDSDVWLWGSRKGRERGEEENERIGEKKKFANKSNKKLAELLECWSSFSQSISVNNASSHALVDLQDFFEDDISSEGLVRSFDSDVKVSRMSNSWSSDVELSMSECGFIKPDANLLQGLTLRLVYCHGKRSSNRKLSSSPGEREITIFGR